ncbi:neuronal acetylcholine receptor subunit alpha-10-like [Ptychodera flava]|uniref:neuronal acetylcholine receptor subunit alpha-10-like n=1 Tax=Ptychodera flava TaxID=63121 RepID=UPI003969BB76
MAHMKWLMLFVFTFIQVGVTLSSEDQRRLMNKLFTNYSVHIRPVYNMNTTTTVEFSVWPAQIINMDEKEQRMTVNAWITMWWVDEYLQWKTSHYGGVDHIWLPTSHIWLPDITLYNNADTRWENFMDKALMIVRNDGHVDWSASVILKSFCKIDIRLFPFDRQQCTLVFGSWQYPQFFIDMKVGMGNISYFVDNGEWDLDGLNISRNTSFYDHLDDPRTPFTEITVTMDLHRRPLFYVLNLIVPCALIFAVTVLGFYLPCDSGEKVTLDITILLSLTVFLLLASEFMPPTSDTIPLIVQYYVITMILVSLSTAMTVIVLNFYHRNPGWHEVPPWLHRLAFGWLGKALCIRMEPTPFLQEKRENANFSVNAHRHNKKERERTVDTVSLLASKRKAKHKSEDIRLEKVFTNFNDIVGHRNTIAENGQRRPNRIHDKYPDDGSLDHLRRFDQVYLESNRQLVRILRQISSQLDELVGRYNDQVLEEELHKEWKQVARVIDRAFLILFVFCTFSTTIGLVLQMPL